MQNFRTIKKEIRIIAWDDGPFKFKKVGKDIVVGVIFRGRQYIDGLLKTEVEVDGIDATQKIVDKMLDTKHKDIRIVMLDGITFAGFNTIDIKELHKRTGLSVIVVNRKRPDIKRFRETIERLPNSDVRIRCLENAGEIYTTSIKNKKLYFQINGIRKDDAESIIKATSALGLMPEPLRVAHLLASGFVLGESVGHA